MKLKREKQQKEKQPLFADIRYDIKHNPYLVLLCLPAIIWFIIFSYLPLLGLAVAFKNFKPQLGIIKSEFVGLKNFKAFFGSEDFFRVTYNTLFLNAVFIVLTMLFSILIAIALSEVSARLFKKVTQSVVILPHFISWTVVALLSEAFLKTDNGMINNLLASMGLQSIKFYQNSAYWPAILTMLRVWQGAGYGSIVYLATITGMDQEIFEAARVDGATRVQCIRYLTLPLLKTTAVMLFIMSIGKIFNGDFGMIWALVGKNTLLYKTTDVIDTYVYRMLIESSNVGQSAAVSLYQSIMGFIMVMFANGVTKKIDSESALF